MALAALLALPSVAAAQSLVQAARAAEEQREEVGEAQRVFTNESLSAEAPPAIPLRRPSAAEAASALAAASIVRGDEGGDAAAGAPETEGGDAAAPDDAAAGAGARDEDYWTGQIAAARAELARNETLLAALQSRVNVLTADFTAVDDPAQRQAIFDERQAALAEQADMQDTLAANREAISAIQEEGRRAGAPAGWLR